MLGERSNGRKWLKHPKLMASWWISYPSKVRNRCFRKRFARRIHCVQGPQWANQGCQVQRPKMGLSQAGGISRISAQYRQYLSVQQYPGMFAHGSGQDADRSRGDVQFQAMVLGRENNLCGAHQAPCHPAAWADSEVSGNFTLRPGRDDRHGQSRR